MDSREPPLVTSGCSGMVLAERSAVSALQADIGDALQIVVTGTAGKVVAHVLPVY
jgi:hypothetical protein